MRFRQAASSNPLFSVVYQFAKLIGEAAPGTPALASARHIEEKLIRRGHLGVASGRFYSYPNPAFDQSGFL
jgi:hypothetical protein